MSEYDSTNSGVIFKPHPDQTLSGQGKINIEGRETRIILVREKLTRDGEPHLVIYERAGVLFKNDRKDNDKAPTFTGPLDNHKEHRIAAWPGQKDGRDYMSLKVSRKDRDGEVKSPHSPAQDAGWGGSGSASSFPNNEIPF